MFVPIFRIGRFAVILHKNDEKGLHHNDDGDDKVGDGHHRRVFNQDDNSYTDDNENQ